MAQDFSIEAQLQRCRQQLLDWLHPTLKEGNCYITIASAAVKGFGRLYVQLYEAGGTTRDAGGGLLRIDWNMGVAIRNVLVVDQLEKFVGASRDLRRFAEQVRDCLHLLYDSDRFPEPPTLSAIAAPRQSPGARGEFVIEQTFRMTSIRRFPGKASVVSVQPAGQDAIDSGGGPPIGYRYRAKWTFDQPVEAIGAPLGLVLGGTGAPLGFVESGSPTEVIASGYANPITAGVTSWEVQDDRNLISRSGVSLGSGTVSA